jgi:NADH-quinone oxidoreductase subunit F
MEPEITNAAQYEQYLDSVRSHGRTMLLPALIAAQQSFRHISPETATAVSKALKVPLADITGMIEFYTMLKIEPVGETHIAVCTSPVCAAKQAHQLLHEMSANAAPGVTTEAVACLGLCDHAPAVLVNDRQVGSVTPKTDLSSANGRVQSRLHGEERMLTQWCEEDVEHTLENFLECGGFQGLRAALEHSPDEVIETVKQSGLRGRGGAGFPTGTKWEGAAQASGHPKYLVINQDESEPGTFKDRALLLGDPFLILEGILIAAYAIGAEHGYFYIRGEYPFAQQVLNHTITQARQAGYLGQRILGREFNFELEIRSGAGAYICGEETALFESIEGKRGFPRIKPPFPTTHGLFGRPTVINNVETIVNIPLIFKIGVDHYRSMGSPAAPGPRLFSLSGSVVDPGVYEITTPVTLRQLIYGLGGGIPNGRKLQAVLLGGAAGKFVPPEKLDLLLTDEALRPLGLSVGSGAVMVYDDQVDLRLVLSSLADFFAHESCGKCYPCQLGTQRQAEITHRMLAGQVLTGDLDRLQDVGWTMTDASLCGLGQTASHAILSAVELWPELIVEPDPKQVRS